MTSPLAVIRTNVAPPSSAVGEVIGDIGFGRVGSSIGRLFGFTPDWNSGCGYDRWRTGEGLSSIFPMGFMARESRRALRLWYPRLEVASCVTIEYRSLIKTTTLGLRAEPISLMLKWAGQNKGALRYA